MGLVVGVEGRASLKPREGRVGMTRWKVGVRGWMRWVRAWAVRGKGGRRRSGTAEAEAERTWMKCRRRRPGAGRPGQGRAVRNWGAEVLRTDSWSRQEYFSSLWGVVSMGGRRRGGRGAYQKSMRDSIWGLGSHQPEEDDDEDVSWGRRVSSSFRRVSSRCFVGIYRCQCCCSASC